MTMRIVFMTLTIITVTVLFLIFINRDLLTTFMVLLGALVIHGSLMDSFINKVEDRLLKQFVDMLSDVRYHFHQHGMVEEAIFDAAEAKSYEASLHAKRVYEILTDIDPEKELENYYEVAPNRFLKVFAGISFLIKEFDKGQFGVQVITGKNPVGVWYSQVVNVTVPKGSAGYGAITGSTATGSLVTSADESSNDYINPSGKFEAQVVMDNSGVVRGLLFRQK
uniref:Uncharacterized protein n=2 Tax=Caenorhabditis japonica TaxID=281687 RepID=A0A8R1IQ43_CAEJA